MPARGDVKSIPAILEALESIGPMSVEELCSHTGYSRATVGPAVAKLHGERRVYINRWIQPMAGAKRPTRVFGIGPYSNRKYTPVGQSESHRRYKARHGAKLALRAAPGLGVFGHMARQLTRSAA
ncbi:ArsR family transcriptional regulator [Achromobacter sp. GG226]|uniref:ArsR family transcriptional regulator n=1 Tax=Verticiella alkaliphila TaxID=2779529 RepID=UPI001C0ACA04|nr:ArsR family transcriptional regulator [Verticiella sp. GG226]MBU4609160.1 ArsR family transcriptional regulator [Verticiella sp. GG226]